MSIIWIFSYVSHNIYSTDIKSNRIFVSPHFKKRFDRYVFVSYFGWVNIYYSIILEINVSYIECIYDTRNECIVNWTNALHTEKRYFTRNKCMTQDEGIITHGTNVSYIEQMYNTRNECIVHGTNVSYTERMYNTRNECIIHAINV